MSLSRKRFILAVTLAATMLPMPSLGVAGLEAAGASTVSNPSCVRDMNRPAAHIPMPVATRLKVTKHLFGYSFTPVTAEFVARAPARDAWRQFKEDKQSTATYVIFLARIHPDNPAGTNAAFESQNVWVAFARHVAFVPDPGPKPNAKVPGCAFGSNVTVINADTGKTIVDAGG
jgi:hypothetical protein